MSDDLITTLKNKYMEQKDTINPVAVAEQPAVVVQPDIIEPSSAIEQPDSCLLYTSPSPRDQRGSRMPSSA